MPSATPYARYAVYFAPGPGTPLAEFGRTWFGYDADGGGEVEPRQDYGLGPEFAARITATPRHYGLHATLTAPFRPATGTSGADLIDRMRQLAHMARPLTLAPLTLQQLGSFLALCPSAPTAALAHLHAKSVFAFDDLRAPLSPADRTRRLSAPLPRNQRLLLEQWGYPYVLDEFRFHITLTGALTAAEQAQVAPALAPALKDIASTPLEIDSLCLFAEPGDGTPFRCLARCPLGGAA